MQEPVRSHPQRPVNINKALATCTHVFVCHDAVRKPLQPPPPPPPPPYDGPYKVLDHSRKHFVIEIKGKRDTISLDHLKPKHQDNNIDLETYITPSAALQNLNQLRLHESPDLDDMFSILFAFLNDHDRLPGLGQFTGGRVL